MQYKCENTITLATRNFKKMIFVDANDAWTSELEILDMSAGHSFVEEYFFMTARDLTVNMVNASRLRSSSNAPINVKTSRSTLSYVTPTSSDLVAFLAPTRHANVMTIKRQGREDHLKSQLPNRHIV